ncbi:MAG: acyltransferase [Oscillospiraceae bacterium]|nr:acyltransferase [Oscillospiraceae bacterium]
MSAKKSVRNYGIDALRIFAMLLVAVLHLLGQGGVLLNPAYRISTHCAAWLLEHMALIAVNCFALISGYVGLKAKHRLSGFVLLWLQVFFYSAGITLLFFVFRPETVSAGNLLHALFPISFSQYWYYTAYCGLFLFMPLLNAAVQQMTRMQFYLTAGGMVLLFTVSKTFTERDPFIMHSGYSAFWLIILYFLGAGIRRFIRLPRQAIPCSLLIFAAASLVGMLLNGNSVNRLYYDDVPTLTASLALFLAFSAMRFRSKAAQSVIGWTAPLTFAVYLTHTHPLVFANLMANRFIRFAQYSVKHMLLSVFLTAMLIFLGSIAAEWVRVRLIRLLHIPQGLAKLDAWLDAKIVKIERSQRRKRRRSRR